MAVTPGYVGSAGITWSASATASVAGQSIGTASWDRIVVVAVTLEDNFTFSSCTIGGITATLGIAGTNTTGTPDNACAIFYAAVPTGTTATISVTLSGSSSLAGRISVWATTGASVPHVGSNSAQGAGVSQTIAGITIPAGGAAYYVFNNATSATATVWTNATLRDDTATATYRHGAADTTTAGTPTVTADAATANQILAGIAFAPYAMTAWPLTTGFKGATAVLKQSYAAPQGGPATLGQPPFIPTPVVATSPEGAFFKTIGSPIGGVIVYTEEATPPSALGWISALSKVPRAARMASIALAASGCVYVPTPPAIDNTTITVWPLTSGEKARPLSRPAQQGYHLFVPAEATIQNTTGTVWPLKVQSEKAAPLNRPAPQGYHLFIPAEATRDNTTNKVWPLVFGEKARPLPLPAQQGQHLFVPAEATVQNTTNTVWPLAFGEKARPLPLPAPAGMWVFNYVTPFVDNNQTIDKWQQPLGRAVAIPRTAPPGLWTFGYPYLGVDNTTGIEKWQQPLSRSVPVPRPAPVGGAPFIPKEATVDNTTGTVWPLTQGEKARSRPRWAPQGQHLFVPAEATLDNTTNRVWPLTQGEKARPIPRVAPPGWWAFGYPYLSVDNTVGIEKWQQPLGRSVPIPRPAPVGGAPFVPRTATIDNTTNTLWPLTFGEQARPIARVAQQGAWVFGYPYISTDNTVTIDKWQQPLSVTLNLGWPRRNYLRGGQPFIPREATVNNTLTGIGWHQPLSSVTKLGRPLRTYLRGGTSPTVPREVAVLNTITGMAWHQPFPRMPRVKPRVTQPLHALRTIPITPNTITGMAWFQPFRGPPRIKPRPTQPVSGRAVFATFEQIVSCDVEVTVNFHICGWGTEAEVADASAPQSERTDVWSTQAEQIDVAAAETERSDTWSEQGERDDEFDEKDECGR